MGGTPEDFISSAFYHYSSKLVARAARILGKIEDAAKNYQQLADEVKSSIQDEYFSKTGRLGINTQTGYVLALFMDLAPEHYRSRVMADLVYRLRRDKVHSRTGFVGTPYLCRVLSDNGANDLAYRLLLNEDFPSWLYAVNLGATTIWERWNSLNPDGSISSTGMNSLNHYAYGAIVEWLYRNVCGLNPSCGEDGVTGFRHARIAPKPDRKLKWAKATCHTAAGLYESRWEIDGKGDLHFDFTIPFNAHALVELPFAKLGEIAINGQKSNQGTQHGEALHLDLPAGLYYIDYQPTQKYKKTFNTYTPIVQVIQNEQARQVLIKVFPMLAMLDDATISALGEATMREMAATPFLSLTSVQLDELDRTLENIAE